MSLIVKSQVLDDARCIIAAEGEEFVYEVGDIFEHRIDGLVRIHYVHVNGDAYWRPLTLKQRAVFYWHKLLEVFPNAST